MGRFSISGRTFLDGYSIPKLGKKTMSPVLSLIFLAVVSFAGAACGDVAGWFDIGAPRFLFHEKPESFADASKICQQVGGHLVYDNHPMINKILAKSGKLQWIGATDAGHEGKWTWTNGTPIKGGNWWPGEPNNCCGGQNCAVVNFGKPGLWDDQGCSLKRPFHCQVHRLGYQYVGYIGRRVLKVHPEKKTWAAAQSVCHAEGGELVKVNSKAMNDWLAKLTLNNVWIGATDNGHEGKWTTPDGNPALKDFWYKPTKEPNNAGGNQNCAVVNFQCCGSHGGKGTWDDQGCGLARSFVCEIML